MPILIIQKSWRCKDFTRIFYLFGIELELIEANDTEAKTACRSEKKDSRR